MGCLGLLDGRGKYGRNNYRATPVIASTYVGAIKRHLEEWFEGIENAEDSSLPHLAHALAGLAILVDAQAAGTLIDDRQYRGGYADLVKRLTPLVRHTQMRHADKAPKHFDIRDNPETLRMVSDLPSLARLPRKSRVMAKTETVFGAQPTRRTRRLPK